MLVTLCRGLLVSCTCSVDTTERNASMTLTFSTWIQWLGYLPRYQALFLWPEMLIPWPYSAQNYTYSEAIQETNISKTSTYSTQKPWVGPNHKSLEVHLKDWEGTPQIWLVTKSICLEDMTEEVGHSRRLSHRMTCMFSIQRPCVGVILWNSKRLQQAGNDIPPASSEPNSYLSSEVSMDASG